MKKKILVFFMLIAAFFFLITAPNNNDNSNNLIDIKEAEAVNHTGGHIYFDNSKTKWNDTYIMLFIGHNSYTSVFQMKKVSNTNLYYAEITKWDNATYFAVVGNGAKWDSGNFGPSEAFDVTHQTKPYKASYSFNSGSSYCIVPSSSSNKCSVSISYHSSMNDVTLTTKSYIFDGADTYSESSVGGITKISATYMSSHGNSGTSTAIGSSSTNKYENIYKYSNVTLEATKNAGYEFVGWYDSAGNKVTSSTTYTLNNITSSQTYYAKWYKKMDVTAGTKLYFVPNKEWKSFSARYVCYFYNPAGSTLWVNFTSEAGGYYSLTIPEGDWSHIIIARMNPETNTNDLENSAILWSKTADLVVPSDSNCFTLYYEEDTSALAAVGTWSTATPDSKTIYFATNQEWTNAYVNVKLNTDANDLWYNTQMTDTGIKYRNDIGVGAQYNKIFSVEIPTLYAGVEEMQFDFDMSDEFTGSHLAVESRMDSSEYAGKLYYLGTGDDSSLTGWKSNNTTVNFYATDKTTLLSTINGKWMDDKIAAPADMVPNDYVNWTALYGWYRNSTLTGDCHNYKTVEVYHENGKTYGSYYAAIANTKRFYFVTNNANLSTTVYANTNVSKTGDIWLNLQMKPLTNSSISNSIDGFYYYKGLKIYYVDMPLPDQEGERGISELEFHAGEWQHTHTVTITDDWMLRADLDESLYFLDTSVEKNATGWKDLVDVTFYPNNGESNIVFKAHEGNILTPPSISPQSQDYAFSGWYSNVELTGSSVSVFTVDASNPYYWASWSIPFYANYQINCIVNSDSPWIDVINANGTVGLFLYCGTAPQAFIDNEKTIVITLDGSGNPVYDIYNGENDGAKITRNSDGSIVFSFKIPDVGSAGNDFANAIFLCMTGETIPIFKDEYGGDAYNPWSSEMVSYQSNDLKRTSDNEGDVYYGYEMDNQATGDTTKYPGNWVHMGGGVSFLNYDGQGAKYSVWHKLGYNVTPPLSASENKYLISWTDKDTNKIEKLTIPYVITSVENKYTAVWGDSSNYINSDFFIKYKESSVLENTYGAIPFYGGIRFSLADNLASLGTTEASKYRVLIKVADAVVFEEVFDTYKEAIAAVAAYNTNFSYNIPILNGYVDKNDAGWDNITKAHSVILEVYGKDTGVLYLNSTLDEISVNGKNKPINISDFIDRYIVEQRFSYVFDLVNDYEDKALYQIHTHTFAETDDVNEKYINDALYLYQYCHVCGYKERVDGVTVTRTPEDNGQYTYQATIDEQSYSFTSINGPLTYIYESYDAQYSADERTVVYAAYTKDDNLIGEYKSLYDAIEACYDYDEQADSFDPITSEGSYVVKIENDEADNHIMFRNRKHYLNDSAADMYWYYQNGTSLQKYGAWDNNYWTSILKSTKYISVQRKGDLESTTEVDESVIHAYASSYDIFASTGIDNSNASQAFNYCFGLDSGIDIFIRPTNDISNVRVWLNLSQAQIYPSYYESDKAWAYVGFVTYAEDYILHQGLKCDTTTGNWYYYCGIVTTTENGIEIKELEYPGVTDICYLTSTWNALGGYYAPDSDVNLAIGLGTSVDTGNDKEITHTDGSKETVNIYRNTISFEMTFEDGRTIICSEDVETYVPTASFRFSCGLDIETTDDLADFMCGAQFKNVIISYAQAYDKTNKRTYQNIHNPYYISNGVTTYDLSGDANYNSTIYNNAVASIDTGERGSACIVTDTAGASSGAAYPVDGLTSPILINSTSDKAYYVPVYNFSYRSLDSSNPALSKKITDVMKTIDDVDNNVDVIVENDYFDLEDNELSFAEYEKIVEDTQATYNTLSEDEKTVIALSYPDNTLVSLYDRKIHDFAQDLINIKLFSYVSSGNVYDGTKNVEQTLGGHYSYNTDTDTHQLLLSLPLYGRVKFTYNNEILTTDNKQEGQRLITVKGLFSKNHADWTQNLYTSSSGDNYTLLCSKATGATYLFEFNSASDLLTISQSTYQNTNFVGPWSTKYNSTGEVVTVADRFKYNYSYYSAEDIREWTNEKRSNGVTFEPSTGLYILDTTKIGNTPEEGIIGYYSGINFWFDGKHITPQNTSIYGLFNSEYDNTKPTLNLSYIGMGTTKGDTSGTINSALFKAYGSANAHYLFIYDPMNNRLFIAPGQNTFTDIYYEDYWSNNEYGVSYWSSNIVLRSTSGWNGGITNTAGDKQTSNGWRLYLVTDSSNKICYSVLNPPANNKFGDYRYSLYYTHPDYYDYKDNPAIKVESEGVWSLVVPTGGFGITAYGNSDSTGDTMDKLAYYLTNSKIINLYDAYNSVWNSRDIIDEGMRIKANVTSTTTDDVTTYSITYTVYYTYTE